MRRRARSSSTGRTRARRSVDRRRGHDRLADVSANARLARTQRRGRDRRARSLARTFVARYRGRALDERIAWSAPTQEPRLEPVADGSRRVPAARDTRAQARGALTGTSRYAVEAVGTGMTGPPGPVIPCTTLRAWPLAVSGGWPARCSPRLRSVDGRPRAKAVNRSRREFALWVAPRRVRSGAVPSDR